MKKVLFLILLLVVGLFVIACSNGSSDDGGTTGDSGTIVDDGDTDTSSTSDTDTSSTSDIWMDAYEFDCTSNWSNRDGPLGITAYSGSGSCQMAFPGATGSYALILYAVLEFDGESPYRVSINGSTVKEGTYPLSSPLFCDCPLDDWRTVCPDINYNINLGTHTISEGDTIGFWGDDVYPCGEHGAYAKWYGIRAIKQ